MAYDTIEIPLTISTDAYQDLDVFCLNTEFGLPAKSCKIISAYLIDKDKQIAGDDAIDFYFFSQNVASLGALGATANISADNFISNKLQGVLTADENNSGTSLDNVKVHLLMSAFDASPPAAMEGVISLRSGIKSATNANPMYVGAVIRDISGLDYTNADAITLVLNVEY